MAASESEWRKPKARQERWAFIGGMEHVCRGIW